MTDATDKPQFIIVMGVSGSGKTTVAKGIAQAMGCAFAEGDDFHSRANVDKMAAGMPLTDEDRWPWLRSIGEWIDGHEAAGKSAVITCSALRRVYRDLLREGRPGVKFCHVDVSQEVLEARLRARKGHYMPASLLPSQLATLEPLQPDEPGVVVHAHGAPADVLREALEALHLPTEAAAKD
ncbi:gluconokinase [Leekyejoonella antrihumi]|uniref:Gluconokinase n=1 Tax=Leekyejoonella antrihumi TaxID=1660198 RepID=A0A563DXQ5_9MICO|nr:gluconokinase [Leekyejoonella antrihumi]TWP34723.1 gluconokinase [Leekyejoonella antrihumi]